MDVLNERHLLTVDGGRIMVFDVRDPANVRMRQRAAVEGTDDGVYFSAAPRLLDGNLLALPLSTCAGTHGPRQRATFRGLKLLEVEPQRGVRVRASVAHPARATGSYEDDWCIDGTLRELGTVRSSLVVGGHVYSLADDALRVQALDTVDGQEATIAIGGE